MMNNTIKVALVYGSTREGRFCDKVVDWVASEMAGRDEFTLDRVDPRAFDSNDHRAMAELKRRIDDADAFIVVTPEYNHGYPAPLKSLIDAVYTQWQGKSVAFVSYGGNSGGLRAVEQLRQVFAELHVAGVRDSVNFSNPWESLDANGKLIAAPGKRKTLMAMLDQLAWWATALRDARLSRPYGRAV